MKRLTWSRLARERELLYSVNTMWQITSALTREQRQLLGREGLQLYEMREVNEAEALGVAADHM